MRSHALAIVAVAVLLGCQRHDSEREQAASPPTAASASVAQPKPGDRIDIHGIVVKFLDGGTVEISGRDRWGNALDTTYESIEFFRGALPVLERSLTVEQTAGLRALLGGR